MWTFKNLQNYLLWIISSDVKNLEEILTGGVLDDMQVPITLLALKKGFL